MIPLYGFIKGDTLGVLLLAGEDQTIEELGTVAQQAASVRVAPRPKVVVVFRGKRLESDLTVGRSGLTALDRVDIVPAEEPS